LAEDEELGSVQTVVETKRPEHPVRDCHRGACRCGLAILGKPGGHRARRSQAGFDSVIGTLSSDQDSEERLATMEYSLDNLKDKYPDSPYAVFSAMIAAGVYMDEGNPEAAAGELQWALDQAHQQPLPRVIRLRLARAQFASGNYEGVVETLQADNDAGEFSPLYRELEGDAQHALGNDQAARQAYQAARDSLGEDSNDRLLELKLSDLAAPEAS